MSDMAAPDGGDLRLEPPLSDDSLTPNDAMLRAQKRLFDLQSELVVEQLRDQRDEREAKREAASIKARADRLRIALNGGLVLVGVLLAVGAVAMVANAARSRNVVIEAFEAPPPLSAAGMSGKVVASNVLDEFIRVQRGVRSSAAQRAASSAWAQRIEVEVPRTGLSVSQIDRLLRRLLGNDTEITGEIVQIAPGRIALTVRGTDIMARRFEGASADLPRMSRQAAEYLYGEAEPILMSIYLGQQSRWADLDRFAQAKLPSIGEPSGRAALLGNWASALQKLDRMDEAVEKLRTATRLDPDSWTLRDSLVMMLGNAGRVEEAAREAQAVHAAFDALPSDRRPPLIQLQNTLIQQNDWLTLDRATREDAERVAGGSGLGNARIYLVENAIMLHDWASAVFELSQLDRSESGTRILRQIAAARRFADQRRWDRAIESYRTAEKLSERFDDNRFGHLFGDYAFVLKQGGQDRQAEAYARELPTDDYGFLTERGSAYAGAGTIAEADKWFSRATGMAPSRAEAWHNWGRAKFVAGDIKGAEDRFRRATRLSPRWADPWKGLGDALAAQNRWREAADAYLTATKRAPAWAEAKAALANAVRRAKS